MKNDIHPNYHKITVQTVDGKKYETKSTWGKEGDLMRLDIDPSVHPAWTGAQKVLVNSGSLAKFNKRYAKFGVSSGETIGSADASIKPADNK